VRTRVASNPLGHVTVAARTSYNNAVRASGRLRRPPEYTALMTRGHVSESEYVERCMAENRSCWRRVANL